MDIETQNRVISILKILQNEKKAMGSTAIARKIIAHGLYWPERTVRYYLKICDDASFTRKISEKSGRILTDLGREEIASSFVMKKLGKMSSRINALSYEMDFILKKKIGTVIMNISIINKKEFYQNKHHIKNVYKKKLGMGEYLLLPSRADEYPEFSGLPAVLKNSNKIIIGTLCSVTLNGIFMKYKIYIKSVFGGLLEMKNHLPFRFTEIINYDGTSLDPIEMFLKVKMTTMRDYLETGSGKITASFREAPAVAYHEVIKLAKNLDHAGLNGILAIGKPGMPLCGIPVAEENFGLIITGGLNPLAPLIEKNIAVENHALHTLFDFSRLKNYNNIL